MRPSSVGRYLNIQLHSPVCARTDRAAIAPTATRLALAGGQGLDPDDRAHTTIPTLVSGGLTHRRTGL